MTAPFAESALTAIEFPAALEQVSEYAVTPQGAARVRGLRPRGDRWWIESELARVTAFAGRLAEQDDVEPVPFPDVTEPLARLHLEGSVLSGQELAAVQVVLAAARVVGAKLRRAAKLAPPVGTLAAATLPGDLEAALARALDPDGRVKDEASKDLARLRRELVEVRRHIVATLEKLLGGVDARLRPADAAVTVRNGRYVIPVRRDARTRLGGIVHDESGTHATLFVEPAETIELGNRLREVEAVEAREVQRVLRELTALLRPHASGLDDAYEMLVATDAAYARARFARALDAVPPRLADAGGALLALRRAAHPLLYRQSAPVVRFDLVLEPGERTVLVSGPNTGGKTVLLKAVGLAVALVQSGVLPPLGPGSVLPVFDAVFADIGDRQSIAESLSTFSAHVAALREVLERAGPASLVLLDELGTGTDPAEGAALAGAALRALTARGATTVATTHLGALKELAGREAGIVNASLAFDAASLAPTYRFAKGVPGRSYGLAIARRLGVDGAVLEEAERTLPNDARRLDATLAAAEARGQALERQAAAQAEADARLRQLEAELARARTELEAREDTVRRREKELERTGRHLQREALLAARAEVERALAIAREGREKEARRAVEERIAGLAGEREASGHGGTEAPRHGDGSGDSVTAEGEPRPDQDRAEPPLAPGSAVRIRSLGIEGTVDSVQGDDVAVLVRGRRVRVRAADLGPARPTSRTPASP
jgi:DNA mismatch repair protein MutS2